MTKLSLKNDAAIMIYLLATDLRAASIPLRLYRKESKACVLEIDNSMEKLSRRFERLPRVRKGSKRESSTVHRRTHSNGATDVRREGSGVR